MRHANISGYLEHGVSRCQAIPFYVACISLILYRGRGRLKVEMITRDLLLLPSCGVHPKCPYVVSIKYSLSELQEHFVALRDRAIQRLTRCG